MRKEKNDEYYGVGSGGNQLWHSKHGNTNGKKSVKDSIKFIMTSASTESHSQRATSTQEKGEDEYK